MSAGDLGAAFAELVAASGRVRDALVTVGDDLETLRRSARVLDQVAGDLESVALAPGAQDAVAALDPDPRYGIRDRGLIPGHTITSADARGLAGVTTIERHFEGVGAVHGGAIALLFDDLLGRLANSAPRPMARTAFLHLDFRLPVPWGRPLGFSCGVARIEGRKRYLEGKLCDDGRVLAEAAGLWVELRPGTPGFDIGR
jgi:acyl-coenzyme A thioesterase PaaI-like protein